MSRRAHEAADAVVLLDDACPTCGTPMVEASAALKLPVNGEEVSIPSSAHLKCPKCGEILLRRDHARSFGELVG